MTVTNSVGVTLTGQTGTGAFVGDDSPTLTTPNIGAATGTSLNLGASTTMTGMIDDDTFATASPSTTASSESIKAYIDSIGPLFPWTEIFGGVTPAVSNNGYIANSGGGSVFTLPATSAIGDRLLFVSKLGLFVLTQGAGQQIHLGAASTTLGGGGVLVSSAQYDALELVCITANTEWAAYSGPQGIYNLL